MSGVVVDSQRRPGSLVIGEDEQRTIDLRLVESGGPN